MHDFTNNWTASNQYGWMGAQFLNKANHFKFSRD